jgi:hypothetical protein
MQILFMLLLYLTYILRFLKKKKKKITSLKYRGGVLIIERENKMKKEAN